jgi:hypothetical protein
MDTEGWTPPQFALEAILQGYSATAGLAAFREAGGRIANSTWYRLTGEMQKMLADKEGNYDEPVDLVPAAEHIQTWTTDKARGFIQQVEVLARDKATGEIISVPFSVSGRSLVSRRNAINQALDVYSSDSADKYEQIILGAVYTGTFEAIPKAA